MDVDSVPQQTAGGAVPEGRQVPEDGTRIGQSGIPELDHDRVPDGGELPDDHTPHEPLPFQRWIKQSASGAVLTGIALGLQQVYQPKRELPAFVMEATGEPEDPNAPITLHFDRDDPSKTVAVIRMPQSGTRSDGGTDPGS